MSRRTCFCVTDGRSSPATAGCARVPTRRHRPADLRRRFAQRLVSYLHDYLIVAIGSTHSYFGHDDWARRAPGLKTLDDAVELRRRVLCAFEEAEAETDRLRQRTWLTFVVVGGGPTGVELAGALAEIARGTRAQAPPLGLPRVARLVGDPHHVPGWISQPNCGAVQLGVRVLTRRRHAQLIIGDEPPVPPVKEERAKTKESRTPRATA